MHSSQVQLVVEKKPYPLEWNGTSSASTGKKILRAVLARPTDLKEIRFEGFASEASTHSEQAEKVEMELLQILDDSLPITSVTSLVFFSIDPPAMTKLIRKFAESLEVLTVETGRSSSDAHFESFCQAISSCPKLATLAIRNVPGSIPRPSFAVQSKEVLKKGHLFLLRAKLKHLFLGGVGARPGIDMSYTDLAETLLASHNSQLRSMQFPSQMALTPFLEFYWKEVQRKGLQDVHPLVHLENVFINWAGDVTVLLKICPEIKLIQSELPYPVKGLIVTYIRDHWEDPSANKKPSPTGKKKELLIVFVVSDADQFAVGRLREAVKAEIACEIGDMPGSNGSQWQMRFRRGNAVVNVRVDKRPTRT